MKIAIFGEMRSGKSTVAQYYKDYLRAEVLDFSDTLKQAAKIIFPSEMNGMIKNRDLLIKFGQHMRKLDKDIWVKNMASRIANSNNLNIIVTGVRQENEYELLKTLGFIFVKIESPVDTRLERIRANGDNFKMEHLENSTETEMQKFHAHYTIINDRKMKDLIIDADNILDDIKNLESVYGY